MDVTNRVKVHESIILADDWAVLKKTRLSFKRRDGTWQEMWRETYDRGDGATILPYDPKRRTVLLGRQFRWPAYVTGHREELIEAAAGLLDDADPEERIRAEVSEELGLALGPARKVFEMYMSPGSVTETLHFFLAEYSAADRISAGGGEIDEGEDIEVLELLIEDAMDMVADGRIRDAKTVILLQHAALEIFGKGTAP